MKRIHSLTNPICLITGLCLLAACQQNSTPAAKPPPPQVAFIETRAETVPIYLEFVGQIFGFKDIAIRARVEGFLEGIHFEEGGNVEAGQLLYTLESQPFEADVAAMMSRVAEAKTMLAKATSDLGRIKPLAARNAVSQSELDGAIAAFEASKASLEAAQANLRVSKIQLSYTKVRAPISGIIGKTNAKVGDFVGRSPNPVILNTVSDVNTVRVEFFLTENQYLRLARMYIGESESREERAEQAQKKNIELILSDGSRYPHPGQFDFIDRQIDPKTGAILVQASFPNPDKLIRPGQFARVRVQAETVPDGILVPQRCVSELQGMHRVFVVGSDNTVTERKVVVGPTIDSQWLIQEGLKPGEKIVYEGLQKIADGALVNPKPAPLESTPTVTK